MSTDVDKWQAYIQRDAAARPNDNDVPPGFKPVSPWKPVQFGVDFVGCEIDADYWQAANERFNSETRQVSFLR